VKGSADIRGFYGWICEFNIVLDIRIYYISDIMIWRILIEEKRTYQFTHFCGCIVPEKASDTYKDNSKASSRQAISFCDVNRMGSICST
jgi:hypothetical protein